MRDAQSTGSSSNPPRDRASYLRGHTVLDKALVSALREVFDSLEPNVNGSVRKAVACETIGKLLDVGSSGLENFQTMCVLDRAGIVSCPDELVDFEEFIRLLDFELTKFEDAESKVLERIWTHLCDFETNYVVDFPPTSTERDRKLRRTASMRCLPEGKDSDADKVQQSGDKVEVRLESTHKPVMVGTGDATQGAKVVAENIGLIKRTKSTGNLEKERLNASEADDGTKDRTVLESAIHTVKSLTAGGIAGATAKTVIAPLDRVKIIFQTSNQPYSFRAALVELKWIANQHGVRSLWKGHSATLARVIPYAGIQFFSFETFKKHLLLPGDEHLTPTRRVLAGAMAGITSVACTYPLDLIRAQLAVSHRAITVGAMRDTVRNIVDKEGVRGLARGLSPTLLGILPYSGLAFGSFETLKQLVTKRRGKNEVTTVERLVCGALAGLVAQSCTYPLDIVRRRIQTDGVLRRSDPVETTIGAPGIAGGGRPGFPQGTVTVDSTARRYFTISQTFFDVLKSEGLSRGLFKGVSMNWLKGPIAVGISFTTFDHMKRVLDVESTGH